jgi:hypothetical protein
MQLGAVIQRRPAENRLRVMINGFGLMIARPL